MKTSINILALFLALLCHNCTKEEAIPSDPYFKDLHDTLVYASSIYNGGIFVLDIDNDGILDVEFEYFNHESQISPKEKYNKITPLNGYEISYSRWVVNRWSWDPLQTDTTFWADTVNIVITYNQGDTVNLNSDWTTEPIMLYYTISPSGPSLGLWNGYQYGVLQTSFYYIVFRKMTSDLQKLAWIKLKNDYNGITLNSCRYQNNSETLIIKVRQ